MDSANSATRATLQIKASPDLGRIAALTACLISAAMYALTLAPSVTWSHEGADSGDLVTAAFVLGIPHPPGYPLFTLIASAFARIPFFEAAAGVGIFVALAAALAVYVLSRAGAWLIAPLELGSLGELIPPIGALALAFAPGLWSQATIAEVYALNLLFSAVILWAIVGGASPEPSPAAPGVVRQGPLRGQNRLLLAAVAFGLGLVHHLVILLLLPGAWLALQPFRPDPATASRADWRALALLFAPLLLYAYLPIRALANPPVNWGDPRTFDAFLWDVTAAPYRSYFMDVSLSDMWGRVRATPNLLFQQFTVFGVALALWGIARLAHTRPRLALALGINLALVVAYSVAYGSRDSFIYLLPAFAIVTLWLMYGAADVVALLAPRIRAQQLAVLALAALPIYDLVVNYNAMSLVSDRTAFNYARAIVESVPRDAVIFADGDEHLFALMYYRFVILENRSSAVIVSQGLLQFPWYYENLRRTMYEVSFKPLEQVTDFHQRAVEIASVTFAEGRTVCFDKSSQVMPEFDYEPHGDLMCVLDQK